MRDSCEYQLIPAQIEQMELQMKHLTLMGAISVNIADRMLAVTAEI